MAENFLHFMASQAERRIAQAQKEGAFEHLPGEAGPSTSKTTPMSPPNCAWPSRY